jgi:prepilin-type N-terminal cleavage/methylation domain-containing protein
MIRAFKSGFTLAEVLISLTIVGVLASLTIPAMITNIADIHYKTAYRKAFSDISNVLNAALNNCEYTPRTGQWDYAATMANFPMLKQHFGVLRECTYDDNDECWDYTGEKICSAGDLYDPTCASEGGGVPGAGSFGFVDNSGRGWNLYDHSENIILVDINGLKGPNKYGKDRWIFTEADKNNVRTTTGLPTKIIPYYHLGGVNDVLTNQWYCHYPPCYFKSWLLN